MKTELVKTKRREIRKVARIYMDEFSKYPYEENWTFPKALKKMRFYYRFYDLYSIKVGKDIVGFIVVNPNFMCPGEVAFVEEFGITEDSQGKGIGTKVMKKILAIYKKKGYSSVMAIASKKSKALDLYKRLGIKESREGLLIEKEFK
jgi:GNAT superfamily N-acetyltransferase